MKCAHRVRSWHALQSAMLATAFACAALLPLGAETGAEAWLRYAALDPRTAKAYEQFPSQAVLLGDSPVLKSAQQELVSGVAQMLGRNLRLGLRPTEKAILLGTVAQLRSVAPDLPSPQELAGDGYWLKSARVGGRECVVIAAANDRGVLYG